MRRLALLSQFVCQLEGNLVPVNIADISDRFATDALCCRHLDVAEGIAPEELRQIAILAITTLGFADAMAAYSWMNDLL